MPTSATPEQLSGLLWTDHEHPNAFVLAQTPSLIDAHTRIRDRSADQVDVRFHSARIFRLLLEGALGLLPRHELCVITPAGHQYLGSRTPLEQVVAVSVVRAGETMESELRNVAPGIRIGKILIQRDRITKQPSLHWAHLPDDTASGHVLLLEPMLATGGSLVTALDVLNEAGVADDRVIVVSLLASPQGISHLGGVRPDVRIVTSSIEQTLDENAYMVPGVGDFGDRWFGTEGTVTWPR